MVGDPSVPFRPILPAPEMAARPRGDDAQDDAGYRSSPVISQRRLLKRIRSVAQACQMCRQMKAKCDGGRPRCGNCVDRDRPCGYEGEAGQSRQVAMRARLAAFETVFASLRAADASETERFLQRLRSNEDPVSIVREEGAVSPTSALSSSGPPSSLPSVAPASSTQQASPAQSPGAISPGLSPGGGMMFTGEANISPRQSVDLLLNNPRSSAPPAAIELAFPDLATTTRAVAAFYSNCNALCHAFTEDETSGFIDLVFAPSAPATFLSQGLDVTDKKIAMSCLAGVAAMGMRSAPAAFSRAACQTMYDIAKLHFELVIDAHPVLGTKLAALLAMLNMMYQNTVALIWTGVGLRLSRTCGFDNRMPPDAATSPPEWARCRKVWRSLVYMSCFLAFAMCALTGQEIEIEKTNPAVMELEGSPDIQEILETESAKISILTVEILRIHLTFKKITTLSFESVMRDLQSWYDKLPTGIHLKALQAGALPPAVVRSAHDLHLLYLGAILLIYRRIATQHNTALFHHASQAILDDGTEPVPIDLLRRGADAARLSAMICSVLLQDDASARQCWVVTLQAYSASIVLLHITAQKQAHGCHSEAWQGDLRRAETCLQVLRDRSDTDDAARELCEKLLPSFDELSRAASAPPLPTSAGASHGWSGGPSSCHENHESAALLLTLPAGASPEQARVPLELMAMLGLPFRNLHGKSRSMDEGRSTSETSSMELPQISKIGW